jgi:hypothetical protein
VNQGARIGADEREDNGLGHGAVINAFFGVTACENRYLSGAFPARRSREQSRGKSGLRRASRQVTPGSGGREAAVTDSATESKPPMAARKRGSGKGERVV